MDCSTLANLKAAAKVSWPKDWTIPEQAMDHIRVTYVDNGGYCITVDSEEDLTIAIRDCIRLFNIQLPGAAGGFPSAREYFK